MVMIDSEEFVVELIGVIEIKIFYSVFVGNEGEFVDFNMDF